MLGNIYINYFVKIFNFSDKKHSKSFLDLLLNTLDEFPDQMTDKDIREEVDTFLFEGHDTSSLAMTMTFILLGMNQHVQVKILILVLERKHNTIYKYNKNIFRIKSETN